MENVAAGTIKSKKASPDVMVLVPLVASIFLCYDRTYNGSKTIDNKTGEQSREKTRHGMKQSRKDFVSVPQEAMDSFPASKLLTDSLQPRSAWVTCVLRVARALDVCGIESLEVPEDYYFLRHARVR